MQNSIAVLLNANARLVTDKVKRSLERAIPRAHLFLSHTKEEALAYVKQIIDKDYKTIFSGGGDGSFVHLLNMVRDTLKARGETGHKEPTLPRFGILKLGTGNGISSFVGSSGGTRILERGFDENSMKTLDMALVETGNRVFHFAGSGFDARLLRDYSDLMKNLKTPEMRKSFSGLAGYFAAGLGKTVPESLFIRDRGEVRVEVEDLENSYFIQHRNGKDVIIPIENPLLYTGPSTAVGVATEPFYGYNIRAFPFATDKVGFMNLRLLLSKPVSLVANMRKYWDGSYRGAGVKDFLVKKVKVTYEKAVPFQIGGDFYDHMQEVVYSVFPQALKLLDFRHT